jgi:hypothetical protein
VLVCNGKGVLVGRRTIAFTCAFFSTAVEVLLGFGRKGEERQDEERIKELHVVD